MCKNGLFSPSCFTGLIVHSEWMTSHFGPWRLYTSADLYESREGGSGGGGGGGAAKKSQNQ